ncbi:hypothetical protein LA080_002673 [Diaporthe eres]|nr:hypothetical protein LA080_002673 [Diaporthe eres]
MLLCSTEIVTPEPDEEDFAPFTSAERISRTFVEGRNNSNNVCASIPAKFSGGRSPGHTGEKGIRSSRTSRFTSRASRSTTELASVLQSRGFRDLRFRINNYFEYNRRGLVPEFENLGQQPWNDALTDPIKALAPYDRQTPPADWNHIYNDRFGNDDEAVRAQQAANMTPFEARAGGFVRPRDEAGDAFVIDLRRRLRRRGLDIRSLRHLGAGGSGLATLFEVRARSGVLKKFVIKSSSIPDEPVLQYEKTIHMSLRRAPYIVRPLLWADDILTGAPDAGDIGPFCQEMDDRKDMVYLEFMKGDVVRACLAMEYPPRLQIQENGYWAWDSETGDDGVERVPDQEHERDGYGLVHFDLDPDNVMIGENNEKHPAAPIFKVGEFGTASMPQNPTFENR